MSDPSAPRNGESLLGQFGAAWTLLSRLPWAGPAPRDPAAIGRGVWAFPIVGGLIGALAGGMYWLARDLELPPLVAAALALTLMALSTGALHEDGLADTVDGFGGGRTREEKLAIMRDSRIGAYGVLALVLVTVLRAGALASMSGGLGFAALTAAAALGRGFAALPMCLMPSARPDGLGRSAGRAPAIATALAAIIGVGIAVILGAAYAVRWTALGAAITAVLVATALTALAARRQIGGITGDAIGAGILVSETMALAALAA